MPVKKQRVSPCLWFDTQAEEAAKYYVRIFRNSKILKIGRYGEAGKEHHQRPSGSVMIVEFKLDEAISLQVWCKDQKEVDYYWDRLSAGGDPKAQVCGWLKDRYGVSWQIVPDIVPKLLGDHKSPKSQRAMAAMMQMAKPDIAAMKRAYAGK